MTPQEYLTAERVAPDRSEYVNGEMRPRFYGGPQHSLVSANLTGVIGRQLRGKPCRVYACDLRLHVPATGLYAYADLSAVCGPVRVVEDGEGDNLLNPTFLGEVYTPETEAFDRGERLWHYQRIETLREYLLVARDRARAESFFRLNGGDWQLTTAEGLRANLKLRSLGVELPLAEVYAGAEFPVRSRSG